MHPGGLSGRRRSLSFTGGPRIYLIDQPGAGLGRDTNRGTRRSGDRLPAAFAGGQCRARGRVPHRTWGKMPSRLSSAGSCRSLCLTLVPRGDNPPILSFPVPDNPVFKGELVPDPRRVAKRINTRRAPAAHHAAPVAPPAPPWGQEQWAHHRGLLIVLWQGGGQEAGGPPKRRSARPSL